MSDYMFSSGQYFIWRSFSFPLSYFLKSLLCYFLYFKVCYFHLNCCNASIKCFKNCVHWDFDLSFVFAANLNDLIISQMIFSYFEQLELLVLQSFDFLYCLEILHLKWVNLLLEMISVHDLTFSFGSTIHLSDNWVIYLLAK